MGQKSVTDFDEHNYHNNEVASVIERRGSMFFYQMEKDWHYRKEERRWTALNDNSAWTRVERVGDKLQRSVVLHPLRYACRRRSTAPEGGGLWASPWALTGAAW